jgi:hypothetical protein
VTSDAAILQKLLNVAGKAGHRSGSRSNTGEVDAVGRRFAYMPTLCAGEELIIGVSARGDHHDTKSDSKEGRTHDPGKCTIRCIAQVM